MVGLWLLIVLAFSSCAGPGTEQHLAPLYTHISTSGGGEEFEALAGAGIARRRKLRDPLEMWGLRPLFLHWPKSEGRTRTQFLYPLGSVVLNSDEFTWWFMPLAYYRGAETDEGREWNFISLPGLYLTRLPDGRHTTMWFPFYGSAEELLTFDELDFYLWPLFVRTKREGRTSYHFPFPFFSYTSAPDAGGWRAWPLVGHTWIEGSYDHWFALWPIFSYNRDNLKAGPEQHRTQWTIFPLYGDVKQGSMHSSTVLWPFFGYASDPATGFWSYDGPWPFIRIRHPGENYSHLSPNKQGSIERMRFWPFWSRYKGDGLTSYWYLWPLINTRHEVYYDGVRDAFTVVPFWQEWKKRTFDGQTHSYRKFFPFFQYERKDDTKSYMFPALSPFWHLPDLDDHYAWIWTLYETTVGPDIRREKALWGIWRREHDTDEERSYLSGVWSRRDYSREGHEVSEQSLLFGLLRWRNDDVDGFSLLSPAFPGPGWPIKRVPNSLDPQTVERGAE